MISLYWLQCGGCGGDTMSLLGTETPNVPTLMQSMGVDLLWRPSLSNLSPVEQGALLNSLKSGDKPLDVLVVEGAVVQGPDGTGMFDPPTVEPALIEDARWSSVLRLYQSGIPGTPPVLRNP